MLYKFSGDYGFVHCLSNIFKRNTVGLYLLLVLIIFRLHLIVVEISYHYLTINFCEMLFYHGILLSYCFRLSICYLDCNHTTIFSFTGILQSYRSFQ